MATSRIAICYRLFNKKTKQALIACPELKRKEGRKTIPCPEVKGEEKEKIIQEVLTRAWQDKVNRYNKQIERGEEPKTKLFKAFREYGLDNFAIEKFDEFIFNTDEEKKEKTIEIQTKLKAIEEGYNELIEENKLFTEEKIDHTKFRIVKITSKDNSFFIRYKLGAKLPSSLLSDFKSSKKNSNDNEAKELIEKGNLEVSLLYEFPLDKEEEARKVYNELLKTPQKINKQVETLLPLEEVLNKLCDKIDNYEKKIILRLKN